MAEMMTVTGVSWGCGVLTPDNMKEGSEYVSTT